MIGKSSRQQWADRQGIDASRNSKSSRTTAKKTAAPAPKETPADRNNIIPDKDTNALGKVDPEIAKNVPDLIKAFSNEDENIRWNAAYSLGDTVDEETKLARLERVIELQRRITLERRREQIGRIADILAEGPAKKGEGELLGRSEMDEMVVFPGSIEDIGTMKKVEFTSLKGRTLVGREAPP